MIRETERKIEQGQRTLTVPVAVLLRDGEIFAMRERSPDKYTSNEWLTLTGRHWRGEEKAKDLLSPAQDCGFKIDIGPKIGWIRGDNHHGLYASRPVRLDFYLCQVIDGDFAPQLIHPLESSNNNQYTRYEGRWFKIEELSQEKQLHPWLRGALKRLQKR